MIIFATNKADSATILAIVERAAAICKKRDLAIDKLSMMMDISACHMNGTPLKLKELLEADEFNFSHDVFGIQRHIDRDDSSPTGGKCLNCFLPRFSV